MAGSSVVSAPPGTQVGLDDSSLAASPIEVSARNQGPGVDRPAIAQAAVPLDVARLLHRYGTCLPHYADVRQLRQAHEARRRWPLLQCIAATEGAQ
jgi:hypothetical protein